MSKILDNLYLGCYADAKNNELLKKLNVTHIVTVGKELKIIFPKAFKYLYIPASDVKDFELIKHFEKITSFIHDAIHNQKTTVFVHCLLGISRSAASVLAYLIRYEGMGYSKANRFVKNKRSAICPNEGFVKQLKEWEKNCKNLMLKGPDIGLQNLNELNSQGKMIETKELLTNPIINQKPDQIFQSGIEAKSLQSETISEVKEKVDVNNIIEEVKHNEIINESDKNDQYECKICGTIMFTKNEILHPKSNNCNLSRNECSFFFVKSKIWTTDTKNPICKILCPNMKCHQIIGVYNLFEGKCSCGFLVSKSAQIKKDKIEKSSKISLSPKDNDNDNQIILTK